ncbi:MAG: hypothetical protein CVU05_04075 [Bacteroidetes bacterium HGW-Bacteroidetes-21]|jgi:serine phosphatase RsbU (regulator of sigma subunit)/ligand-binding sensor domain-containing protein|nr:MAG: hypothetical protein CVU05_04075 [Bacteroidetes bacterium HGW-Bacteroidetes-21]
MRRFLSILFCLSTLTAVGQFNTTGYPFIRNYSPKEYQAQSPNVAIAMDSRGVMFFANNDRGVIEYDGNSWRHISIDNHSICKSLAIDTNDILYVGAVGEFGYISPDKNGNSKYHSLTYLIDTSQVKFTNIWKTYVTNKGVYFCSLSHIFHYRYPEYLKVIELPEGSFFSFLLGRRIVTGNYLLGMLELKNDKMEILQGIEPLIDQDIIKVLPFRLNQWLVVTYKGLFVYDLGTKKASPLAGQTAVDNTNKFITECQLYNGAPISDMGYSFATLDEGLFITDKKARLKDQFKDKKGLDNSTVSDVLYNENQGVLWATFESGISRIEYNSPFRIFGKESNINGTVLSAIRHEGVLYAGRFTGLSYLTFDENNLPWFEEIQQLKGNFVYDLVSVDIENAPPKLIACASDDLYEIKGKEAIPFKAKNISANCATSSKFRKNTFFVGNAKGITIATWQNGIWNVNKILNTDFETYHICEDNEGYIWASTNIDGIVRISPDNKVTVFTSKDGLISNSDLTVFFNENDNKLIVANRNKLFTFNKTLNKFVSDTVLSKIGNDTTTFFRSIAPGYINSLWINRNNRLQKVTPHYDGFLVDSTTFKRLPAMSIESFYTESNGITWLCTSEGLISYDNLYKAPKDKGFNALIRSVSISPFDSVIYGGTFTEEKVFGKDTIYIPVRQQPANTKIDLDYKYNNLIFTFASPYFQDEASIQYSYILEGYDNAWSKWSNIPRAVFTNLSEGNYTFKVQAMNVYGQISNESAYSFSISPPWYRTYWAYAGYIILAIFILYISIKIYTRKLEADKKRLEGIVEERTAEVVKQKDEILEKNKEIEHKNKDITDSIVYAKRIQEALLPVKDQVNVPNAEFFIYFRPKDIVSGDFYFLRQLSRSNMLVAAAADCTGHGVPGAFMSMLGMSFLNELIARPDIQHSDDLLNHLREHIILSLNPKGKETETKDGMDISLIAYDYKNNRLEWSGANNPLYHFSNGELTEYKADKMPIGLHDRRNDPFKREEIIPKPGDIIYLFSDGFADQFGGEKGRKYMSKNMKEFLLTIHQKPMEEQERLIGEESTKWRGPLEQIDDQIVMGIRFL